jgi:homospermidine synthase
MTKWYISQTDVSLVDDKLVATETPLTRQDTEQATREMYRRMEHIGVPNIHLCKPNTKRYNKLTREYNKRRKADRELTVAEVAAIMSDDS